MKALLNLLVCCSAGGGAGRSSVSVSVPVPCPLLSIIGISSLPVAQISEAVLLESTPVILYHVGSGGVLENLEDKREEQRQHKDGQSHTDDQSELGKGLGSLSDVSGARFLSLFAFDETGEGEKLEEQQPNPRRKTEDLDS
jgi:hypothetical protein